MVRLRFERKDGVYTSAPKCMRCADKEAFAVLARNVWFVKALPVDKEVMW